MQLITNWKDAWKMTSVQIAAVIMMVDIIDQLSPILRDFLPPGANAILAASVIIARVVLQPKLSTENGKV